MKHELSRRKFIQTSLGAGLSLALFRNMPEFAEMAAKGMKFGFVTYQWGRDWDLPTLLANCEKAGFLGVELRVDHAHKVEINLTPAQRAEVKKRFAGSAVTCVGYGSNFEFHSPDPEQLKKNIDGTKEYIKLCRDIGATGIKVKPNDIPASVPREKTITQIASALNECGKFAQDYGQLVRVECHGNISSRIPNMKAIFEQVTEKNVKMCWNSNNVDTDSPGLEANFNSVKQYFGDTIHVNELNGTRNYPYQQLFSLLTGMKYKGWVLLEAVTSPDDRIAAMKEQLALFNQMIGKR